MPKRLIYCLLLLALIVGIGVLVPILERKKRENESDGNAVSVAASGFNALFRLLKVTNKETIQLWQHSMMLLDDQKPQTIWFMEPDDSFFSDSTYYVQHLRSLASHGSNLIFIFQPHTQEHKIKQLNQWFNLKLSPYTIPFSKTIEVNSHFPSRRISQLTYIRPPVSEKEWLQKTLETRKIIKEAQRRIEKGQKIKSNTTLETHELQLTGWDSKLLGKAEILLETAQGHVPLIVRIPYGKGSITVFANSPYLENLQLGYADNAALAVALSERNASPSTLFEVYSAGFNENQDLISYLATSRGILILITLLLGLAASCVWLTAQPIRKKINTPKSDDRFFTQEVFIDALANHYQSTQNWGELYEKFTQAFRHQIEQKISNKSFDDQLMLIAENPFYEVTLADLKTCFDYLTPKSEADFIRLSQHLLIVQGKVNRYEQPLHSKQLSISSAR